jgi:two-component system, NtrC family, sensor kinase
MHPGPGDRLARGSPVKLVRRLTLYLLAVIGAVFALATYLSLRQHVDLFDEDLRHDERVLGLALGRAIEFAWSDQGRGHALKLVRELNERERDIRIRFVLLDAERGSALGPDAPLDALEAIRSERTVTHVRGEREKRIYTYVPLDIAEEQSATLELSESLTDENRYLMTRLRSEFATAAALIIACGLVAWIVGVRVVGRPIRGLVEKARRIGSGDFSGPLLLRQRDELGQLAQEMNATADRLDTAARRIAAESAARIETLEQLHHAERLGTVGKLASGIAHELGTPLNIVSGRAQMILSGEVAGPQETTHAARIIVEQVERITRIVRQLLDFCRRSSPQKRAIDVLQVARQTAELLAPLAMKRRVELVCDGPADPPGTFADPGQLQQALTNLVVNAIQATPRGGHVRIGVEEADHPPSPAIATQPGPYVVIAVEDDGEGIPADRLSSVFDPFFTTKGVGEGTGLGLSVAYGIVQEHGGWIDVQSDPGRGSCFRIWLARRDDDPGADRR